MIGVVKWKHYREVCPGVVDEDMGGITYVFIILIGMDCF